MPAYDWIDQRLDQLSAGQLRRRLVDREQADGAVITLNDRRLINFSSNDYLGLANDPRLKQSVTAAMDRYGWGAGASPLITGHTELHRRLEQALSKFEEAEDAVLFPTGFAANVGVITALADADTAIFSDAKNHASIIDGCRLAAASGASAQIYQHRDVDHLRSLVDQCTTKKRLIVTDTLFSMDGDVAPLSHIVQVADRYGAMVVADEAHATGVLGAQGKGGCEVLAAETGCIPDCVLRVGTLSKALGSLGGFVVGPTKVIEWLVNRSRTLIYSTAAPAAVCAAGLAALEIVQCEPHRRETLLKNAATLRNRLADSQWDCGDSCSQIIPISIGDKAEVMRMAAGLREAGLLVPAIRPPSVPDGESLLRISLSFDHTEEHLGKLVKVLDGLRR